MVHICMEHLCVASHKIMSEPVFSSRAHPNQIQSCQEHDIYDAFSQVSELLRQSQVELAQQDDAIDKLQRSVERLSTTRGAIRTLLAGIAIKLRVYHALKKSAIFGRLFSPQQSHVQMPEQNFFYSPADNVERSLDKTLAELFLCVGNLKRIVCVVSDERLLLTGMMLSKVGVRVVCITQGYECSLPQSDRLMLFHGSMDDWLSKSPIRPLTDIDGILLDKSEMVPVFRSLTAQLFPDTVVIINACDGKQAQGLPQPCRILGSYYIYDSPPFKSLLFGYDVSE